MERKHDSTPGGAGEFEVKVGLSRMLKGGVIMDVTDATQAKIAEQAGAIAVMADPQSAKGRTISSQRRIGGMAEGEDGLFKI